eukprot:CAMPEP_0194368200 /NCGR_PEP_ID=MMETSP0174-20130528/16443_1 /TAXON_ID=216777 /ORGANISM="Proboscia alata, Strain PI-D3" /LENGTH=932 /DNA_ID=CAMNT_0039144457 /DNA_START=328 /DNA_END=3126 /DNA_ORIENTATION=+
MTSSSSSNSLEPTIGATIGIKSKEQPKQPQQLWWKEVLERRRLAQLHLRNSSTNYSHRIINEEHNGIDSLQHMPSMTTSALKVNPQLEYNTCAAKLATRIISEAAEMASAVTDSSTEIQCASSDGRDDGNAKVTVQKVISKSSPNVKKTTKVSLDTKIYALASILDISYQSSKTLFRKSGAFGLESASVELLRQKCLDYSVLFRCSNKDFAKVVKRYPNILNHNVQTITKKLLRLDELFCFNNNEPTIVSTSTTLDQKNIAGINKKTLKLIGRVPSLLAYDVSSLQVKVDSFKYLLLGGDPFQKAKLSGKQGKIDEELMFAKCLRRCPELLLCDIEQTIAPKLAKLDKILTCRSTDTKREGENGSNDFASREPGATLALREPRLLMYDIDTTLKQKADLWRGRVSDITSFDYFLSRYPSILLYSFGSCARLEYYSYCHSRFGSYNVKPDVSETRTLIMLSKKKIEVWAGDEDPFRITSVFGGGRKSQKMKQSLPIEKHRKVMSYKGWIASKLCSPVFNSSPPSIAISSRESVIMGESMTVDALEKLYGLALRGDLRSTQQQYLRSNKDSKSSLPGDVGRNVFSFASKLSGQIITESKNTEDDLKRRAYNLSPNVDVISKLLPSVSTWDLFIRYPRIFVTPLPDLKMRLYKLSNLLSHHDEATLISNDNGNAVDIGSLVMKVPQLLDPAINYEYIEEQFEGLSTLLFPSISRSNFCDAVINTPLLLLPNSNNPAQTKSSHSQRQQQQPSRFLAKVQYLLQTVASDDRDQLVDLMIRQPKNILFCDELAICRLEYLKDCSKPSVIEALSKEDASIIEIATAILSSTKKKEDAFDKTNDDYLNDKADIVTNTEYLPLGQVLALIRRNDNVEGMASRHPFYEIFLRERLKEANLKNKKAAMRWIDFNEWKGLAEGEEELSAIILDEIRTSRRISLQ